MDLILFISLYTNGDHNIIIQPSSKVDRTRVQDTSAMYTVFTQVIF